MQEKRPSDLERLINDTISSAFHSGDFRQLKNMMDITSKEVIKHTAHLGEQLSKTVGDAVTDAQKRQSFTANRPGAPYGSPQTYPRPAARPAGHVRPKGFDEEMAKRIRAASSGKTERIPNQSLTTGLIIGGIVFASLFLGQGVGMAQNISRLGEAIFCCGLAVGSAALAGYGIRRVSLRRLRLYRQTIGQKQVVQIEELARTVGKSERFALRDLRRFIKKGEFPQAHFDDNNTMLIMTDKAYEQYRTGEANRKLRELREARIKEDPNGMEAVMAEGEEWIAKIRRANDALPGEEISRKLDRLESVTRKIFSTVERKPEKLSEIRRFMNYYLPTTVKLVGAYQEFEAQPVQGANIQSTKQEILTILDTVNSAFAALLDSLYEHDALDISSDITVLKNMLAQEGLTESEFPAPSPKSNRQEESK